jgi:hypothetical protein
MAGLYEGQSSSSSDEGSDEPQSFLYKDYDVYNLKELVEYDDVYFYGCKKYNWKAIDMKNIPSDSIFYAKKKRNGDWVEKEPREHGVKILIKSEWVESNVKKFVENRGGVVSQGLREAPPILELKEHEKFRDDEGNVYEVEVRGVRDEDKIFFNGKDIEDLFEMENLLKNINECYTVKEDYETFLIRIFLDPIKKGPGKFVKKIFLTYNGLFEVIRKARSGTADRFKKWANKVVYTAHLGTEEQRDELALEISGVDHKIARKVFSACPVPLSCVYLFRIGKMQVMKQLNHELSHLDTSGGKDYNMCKFGLSDNLIRRVGEQFTAYTKKFKGTSFDMLIFIPINEKLLYKAEKNLADFFRKENKMIDLKGKNELVMLSREDMAGVTAKYKELRELYGVAGDMKVVMGENNVLTTQVEQFNTQVEQLTAQVQVLTIQLQQSNSDREQWNSDREQWNSDREQWNKREDILTNQLQQSSNREDKQARKLKQHDQRQKVRCEVKQKMLEVEVKISQETDPEVKDQLTSRFEKLNIVLRKPSPLDDSD